MSDKAGCSVGGTACGPVPEVKIGMFSVAPVLRPLALDFGQKGVSP